MLKQKFLCFITNFLLIIIKALGEKEFQDGIYGLKRFLQKLDEKIKVVSANLITDDEPEIHSLGRLSKSAILHVYMNNEEFKICVIGYTYKKDQYFRNIGRLKFVDPFDAVLRESNRLKYKEKCSFIIALGHSELKTDLKIARKTHVNLVISGNSMNLTQDTDSKLSSYPIIATKLIYEEQSTVYVGKIAANKQQCGRFDFNYDHDRGDGFIYSSSELLNMNLNKTENDTGPITETGPIMETLRSHRKKIFEMQKEVLSSKIDINDHLEDCKSTVCCLGSLLSDSMIFTIKNSEPFVLSKTNIDGAIVTANAFKQNFRSHLFTKYKIFEMFTLTENIHLVEIPGSLLLKTFEKNSQNYLTDDFLQVSIQIQVSYNITSDQMISLNTVLIDGEVIKETKTYNILITSYLRNGNGGYNELKYLKELSIIPCYEFEALYLFLKKNIHISLEKIHDRIRTHSITDNQAIRLDNLSLTIFLIYFYFIYFYCFLN